MNLSYCIYEELKRNNSFGFSSCSRNLNIAIFCYSQTILYSNLPALLSRFCICLHIHIHLCFVYCLFLLYLYKNTNTPHRPAPISQTNITCVPVADTLRPLNKQNLFQAHRSTVALAVTASLDRCLHRKARSRVGIRFCPNRVEFIALKQRIIITLTVAGGKPFIIFLFNRVAIAISKNAL